jgi:hypothetical protein
MGTLGTTVQQISVPSLGMAEAMLKGVTPERFARFTCPGGVAVQSNHPAWNYGHLAIYPVKVLAMCALPTDGLANPDGWEELFGAGSTCEDDARGSMYPPMSAITEHFFKGYNQLVAACAQADDQAMLQLHSGSDRMRERFPTVLAVCSFMVGSHIMMHLGQVSTWRRCEGLGSAM